MREEGFSDGREVEMRSGQVIGFLAPSPRSRLYYQNENRAVSIRGF
jgi:hypothetical protein